MPTFEVHYSFTCPVCFQPNAGREDIVADDTSLQDSIQLPLQVARIAIGSCLAIIL
jgi:hypothetical protein